MKKLITWMVLMMTVLTLGTALSYAFGYEKYRSYREMAMQDRAKAYMFLLYAEHAETQDSRIGYLMASQNFFGRASAYENVADIEGEP